MKSGIRLRCAGSILVLMSQYSRLNKTASLATQKRLPRTWYMLYVVPITTHAHTHVRLKLIGEKQKKRRDKKKKKESEKGKGNKK